MMTFIFEIVIDPKSLRSSSKCPQLIHQRITILLNFFKKCIRPFFLLFSLKEDIKFAINIPNRTIFHKQIGGRQNRNFNIFVQQLMMTTRRKSCEKSTVCLTSINLYSWKL